jgi:hypothetical protein
MNEEAAAIVVTKKGIVDDVILVPNGHKDDKAEGIFSKTCEKILNMTPETANMDDGYMENEEGTCVCLTWPRLPEYVYENRCRVCAHDVKFYFKGEDYISEEIENLMNEEAYERAKSMIIEDYTSGELNLENDEYSFQGWWEIEK